MRYKYVKMYIYTNKGEGHNNVKINSYICIKVLNGILYKYLIRQEIRIIMGLSCLHLKGPHDSFTISL